MENKHNLTVDNIAYGKPPIKLLTLWALNKNLEFRNVSKGIICHGIWETYGVEITKDRRVYELVCVAPSHKDLKAGDSVKMYEAWILFMCHPVEIKHLPPLMSTEQEVGCYNCKYYRSSCGRYTMNPRLLENPQECGYNTTFPHWEKK